MSDHVTLLNKLITRKYIDFTAYQINFKIHHTKLTNNHKGVSWNRFHHEEKTSPQRLKKAVNQFHIVSINSCHINVSLYEIK